MSQMYDLGHRRPRRLRTILLRIVIRVFSDTASALSLRREFQGTQPYRKDTTISTCPASSYRGSIFRIMSSMRPVDDLVRGKSLYVAEAERLLDMLRLPCEDLSSLFLIDEPLRGTNSEERRAASREILRYLSDRDALVVAATHDVDMADSLKEVYTIYHFSEEAAAGSLFFDYRLKPGMMRMGNALRWLAQLGYPSEVLERAQRELS